MFCLEFEEELVVGELILDMVLDEKKNSERKIKN